MIRIIAIAALAVVGSMSIAGTFYDAAKATGHGNAGIVIALAISAIGSVAAILNAGISVRELVDAEFSKERK